MKNIHFYDQIYIIGKKNSKFSDYYIFNLFEAPQEIRNIEHFLIGDLRKIYI